MRRRKERTRLSVTSRGDVEINSYRMFSGDQQHLLDALAELVSSDDSHLVLTANVDQVVQISSSSEAARAFEKASLRTLDGAPLVFLARCLGARSCYRNTGADLLTASARVSGSKNWTVAVAGGAADVGVNAVRALADEFPDAKICHVPMPRTEAMQPADLDKVIGDLELANADVTFVCLGFPKQESWILDNLQRLPKSVYLGAGASIDFAGGAVQRAPEILQKMGFEWAYRLSREPKRLWRRYLLQDAGFLLVTLRSMLAALTTPVRRALVARGGGIRARAVGDRSRSQISAVPPSHVDRLIVHQFDLNRSSPGGIDTCIRGLLRYLPTAETVAVIGVDAVTSSGRVIGTWEEHSLGSRTIYFLPVSRLDPADQNRRVPHSVRLASGMVRYRRCIPHASLIQVHRADMAVVALAGRIAPLAYFVHTQADGLTGDNSDSIWKYAGAIHRRMEEWVVRRSNSVTVFNEEYAQSVRLFNSRTMFSPTWFDPENMSDSAEDSKSRVIWAGRLERPKDPDLAVETMVTLVDRDDAGGWTLDVFGYGSLADQLRERVADLPQKYQSRIRLRGRVSQDVLGVEMAKSSVFLMTSHPGYEGYPRVLVEALASGLPAVVTDGADTGRLVIDGVNGATVETRNPDDLAEAVLRARQVDRGKVAESVRHLGAPQVVNRIYLHTSLTEGTSGR